MFHNEMDMFKLVYSCMTKPLIKVVCIACESMKLHRLTRGLKFSYGLCNIFIKILPFKIELKNETFTFKLQDRETKYKCIQQYDGSCHCSITKPAESIHLLVPEVERKRHLLEVYRTVVGYSAGLASDLLSKVGPILPLHKKCEQFMCKLSVNLYKLLVK
jgi:hypothetical protein